MEWSRPMVVLLITTLYLAHSMPTEKSTTIRSTSIGNTTKTIIIQPRDNTTSLDMVYDDRTPPKVKQQIKIKHEIENSHAGVAIPLDGDSLEMEETTKKLNFYKIEKPTTNSGLSTWILLSGQTSLTTKSPPTRKPIIKPISEEKLKQNLTAIFNDKPIRTVKPIFKQRPTTTQKPTTTIIVEPTKVTIKNTTKLTKVKATASNNSTNKKVITTTQSTTKKLPTTTSVTTEKTISSTHIIVEKNITSENTTMSSLDSSALPLESKNNESDLPNVDNKKKKTTKRKKNKNRRRKPEDRDSNSTSISKPTKIFKDKPIGTQLYNYLAREIMPTVGVGLVGLMVTAGLASYFLYPFGIARRTFEVDRKDKEEYYYNDYSGGMPEEEAIGKVIAGMPGNSLFENSYKSPTSRNAFLSSKYKLADRRAQIQRNPYESMVQGTVENVPITSMKDKETTYDKATYQNNYEPISYSSGIDTRYTPTVDNKFVVGNVPKEIVTEVTPAAVPEHGPRNINLETNYAEEPIFLVGNPYKETIKNIKPGAIPMQRPRSLKIRRKRSEMSNDIDNEIISSQDRDETTTQSKPEEVNIKNGTTLVSSVSNTTEKNEITTVNTQTTTGLPEKINSFIDLMKELIHLKAKIGLQMIQNATKSISNYISRVQTRLDHHYREYSKNKP